MDRATIEEIRKMRKNEKKKKKKKINLKSCRNGADFC
jgi:hypothetical protein